MLRESQQQSAAPPSKSVVSSLITMVTGSHQNTTVVRSFLSEGVSKLRTYYQYAVLEAETR